MPSEPSPELKFEIGHVLFIDIVGYSKLLINEQSEQIQKLNEIVRGTEQFRSGEAEGKLLRLPTGDGSALVFRTSPEAPVLCAMEISKGLKQYPDLRVRMGIHSGPVKEVTDLNDQANIAGAGISIAQRVMDCGDAGHILLSKRVADDLEQYPQWRPLLHELGECEVKHGRKIQLVNFFTDEVGNPATPTRCAQHQSSKSGRTTRARSPGGIAVLPLENLSGQPEEEFFADGMTEALITDLAKIAGLKVISRGSVMGFKGTKQPLSEIGRSLGVDSIVEGSVMRSRDRVRISARLVRAETDEYLWAERYDRELADVLSLQDEVARAIAKAIDQTLHSRAATAPRRVDPEVYLLDLRGRHFWHQRTESSFRSALRMFEDAVARDPTYAPAYVGIGESLNMLANYGLVSARQIRPRSLAAAQRALELDPDSAAAHRVLAFVHWQFEFKWEAAIAEYERSLELDPHSSATTYWFGLYLAVIGFFDRSNELLDRAHEFDPLSLVVPSVQGWTRIFARRFEEALPFLEEVLRIDPQFHLALWFQGEALTQLGRYEEGINALRRAYELGGQTSRVLAYLGNACGRAGERDRARECLAELDAREQRHDYVPHYFRALILAGLGESDRALDRLEQAHREGDTMLRDLKADPHWDSMRSLPRFEQLMRQMAYPEPPKSRR
jgi:TolB-like protein/Tfp pilus assembly protein PilF